MTTRLTRRSVGALLAGGAALLATPRIGRAQGAAWPARPVRLVVPFAAGGAPDAIARPLAERLAARWRQQVTIENRAGAGSNVGTDVVARADADGYTLLLASFATAVNRYLYPSLTWDAVNDFAPISHLINTPNFLIVPGSSPHRSVADLVAHARANPGRVTYASSGAGSSLHLIAELFRASTGTQLTHVPYRGSAPALTDIIAGRIDMMMNSVGTTLPQMANGGVRALGVTSATRSAGAPDVPTMTEAGIAGFPANSWFGLMAPARTPAEIVERVSADARAVMAEREIVQLMAQTSNEIVASDAAGLRRHIASEMARWEPIIRANNIAAEG